MTNEELDQARADEAWRIYNLDPASGGPAITAARLAREGWMPVDPLLIEARKLCVVYKAGSGHMANRYLKGDFDSDPEMEFALAALKRGIEIGKEKAGG